METIDDFQNVSKYQVTSPYALLNKHKELLLISFGDEFKYESSILSMNSARPMLNLGISARRICFKNII